MRRLYIVSPETVVDDTIIEAATKNKCTEIAQGVPPKLTGKVYGYYPIVYVENDPFKLRLAQLIKPKILKAISLLPSPEKCGCKSRKIRLMKWIESQATGNGPLKEAG